MSDPVPLSQAIAELLGSMPGPNTGIRAALTAAARGWHVFPCEGKQPRPRWKWAQWNTTDPKLIRQWWADGGNVGIATGPSGLVVIDLDHDPAKTMPAPWDTVPGVVDGADVFSVLAEAHDDPHWPDTYITRTPRGGWHFYYQAGDHGIRNSAGQLGPMIDVRAAGGFVVAAGSVRDDGEYELISDAAPAPLPGWLAQLCVKAKPQEDTPSSPDRKNIPVAHNNAYVRKAVQAEAAAVAAAPQGQRNDQLNRSAYALARFVASGDLLEAEVLGVLGDAAGQAGLSAYEARRTIESALKGRTR